MAEHPVRCRACGTLLSSRGDTVDGQIDPTWTFWCTNKACLLHNRPLAAKEPAPPVSTDHLEPPLEVRTFILWGTEAQKRFQIKRLEVRGWAHAPVEIFHAGPMRFEFTRPA